LIFRSLTLLFSLFILVPTSCLRFHNPILLLSYMVHRLMMSTFVNSLVTLDLIVRNSSTFQKCALNCFECALFCFDLSNFREVLVLWLVCIQSLLKLFLIWITVWCVYFWFEFLFMIMFFPGSTSFVIFPFYVVIQSLRFRSLDTWISLGHLWSFAIWYWIKSSSIPSQGLVFVTMTRLVWSH